MPYSVIDGDISDFFDALVDVTTTFSTEELRQYLLNIGHSDHEARDAVTSWQKDRLERVDGSWETFTLTPSGVAAVEELRARID